MNLISKDKNARLLEKHDDFSLASHLSHHRIPLPLLYSLLPVVPP